MPLISVCGLVQGEMEDGLMDLFSVCFQASSQESAAGQDDGFGPYFTFRQISSNGYLKVTAGGLPYLQDSILMKNRNPFGKQSPGEGVIEA